MNRIEQLTEQYFSNTLTEKDAGELKELLGKDAEAAADFVFQQQLSGKLQAKNLWKTDKEPLQQYPVGKSGATILRMPVLMRVAAALAALVAVVWLIMPNKPIQEVVANNLEPMKAIKDWGTLGGGAVLPAEDIRKAYDLYDAGKYPEAAGLFAQAVSQEPDNLNHKLFYGICLLKKGDQFGTAAEILEPVTRADGKFYRLKTPALYYYGLAQAGAGNNAAAKEALNSYIGTTDDDIPFKKQAEAVRKALK